MERPSYFCTYFGFFSVFFFVRQMGDVHVKYFFLYVRTYLPSFLHFFAFCVLSFLCWCSLKIHTSAAYVISEESPAAAQMEIFRSGNSIMSWLLETPEHSEEERPPTQSHFMLHRDTCNEKIGEACETVLTIASVPPSNSGQSRPIQPVHLNTCSNWHEISVKKTTWSNAASLKLAVIDNVAALLCSLVLKWKGFDLRTQLQQTWGAAF